MSATCEEVPGYAGAIIKFQEDFFLQRRDNNPEIKNPGKVTCWGGAIECGEEPINALRRELEEELKLVGDIRIDLIKILVRNTDQGEKSYHLYMAEVEDLEGVEVREGQGMVRVSRSNYADLEESMTEITRSVLSLIL